MHGVQEVRLLQQRLAAVERSHAEDADAAAATIQSLQRAADDVKVEYERLLQAALDHRSRDDNLQRQRLASSQGDSLSAHHYHCLSLRTPFCDAML